MRNRGQKTELLTSVFRFLTSEITASVTPKAAKEKKKTLQALIVFRLQSQPMVGVPEEVAKEDLRTLQLSGRLER
ncbi:MAG: hypothetical protein ACE5NM_09260 [Sedimentisphaerales bacterium]